MQPPATPTPTTPAVTGVANNSNKGTKVELQTSYLALIAGLLANYQPGDTFALASGNLTRDQLIAQFQGFVTSAENTKSSNQAWRADVQAERAEAAQVAPLRAGVKSILQAKLGRSSAQLLTYGFNPAKIPVRTPAEKTAAAAKAKATRAARGTKGSQQKLQVTGNVTGVVITPMVAGAPVPAAQAPAANGASANSGTSAPAAGASPPAPAGTPPHA
jgi:hypothetical protein